MKFYFSKKQMRRYRMYPWILLLVFIFSQCIFMDGVEQPSAVQSGSVMTAVVKLRLEPETGVSTQLVIGFLAPKKWKAAKNTTVTYTSNIGNGTMGLMPADAKPEKGAADWPASIESKAGIGANILKDMEWVVFVSDKAYDVSDGQKISAKVTVEVKTDENDVICDLGYFVACTTEPLSTEEAFDFKFARIETTGGKGPATNFLVPQVVIFNPLSNTSENDFMKITFDGSLVENDLVNAPAVYLCATAYTSDGQEISVCGKGEKEKMVSAGKDIWEIGIWPRGYFNVSKSQKIDSMKYYFTNAGGDKTVKQFGSDLPFIRVFGCD